MKSSQSIRRFSFCILSLFSSVFSYAQGFDFTRPADVVQPSPIAAGLFRDVNIPVNYYTGTPEIDIPLVTIGQGTLQMPIHMRYTATGIKVEQEAGLIGLGWDLNAGGLISRSVVGKADEAGFGAYGPGFRISAANVHMPLPEHSDSFYLWYTGLSSCKLQDLSNGDLDLCPDNYFIQVPGHSARLFFDQLARPFFSPFQPWKITGNENSGFALTVEDGTRYEFSLTENSEDIFETLPADKVSTSNANTTWYLTKILAPTKTDSIVLSYTAITYHPISYNDAITQAYWIKGQNVTNYVAPVDSYSSHTHATHTINGYVLTTIQSTDQKIEFYLNMNREDIPTTDDGMPYKLDSIKSFALDNAGQPSLLRQMTFNYDYYNAAASTIAKRLRLLAVDITGANREAGEHYAFDYDDTQPLPNRNSTRQDSWGYDNHKINSFGLIPVYTDVNGNTYPGGDRSADSTMAGQGLLTKITYPTGGTTTFEYEANRYASSPAGTRDTLDESHSVTTHTGSYGDPGNDTATSAPIVIIFRQEVRLDYTINNNVEGAMVFLTQTPDFNPNNALFSHQTNTTASDSYNITLDPGVYYLQASRDQAYQHQEFGKITMNYVTHVAAPYVGKPVGGARIKRIIQSDGIKQSVKRFTYQIDSISSAGRLIHMPVYQDAQFAPRYFTSNLSSKAGDWTYQAMHSVPTADLGRTQGSHICYTKVTVLNGDQGENGREEYEYHFQLDFGSTGYPYAPVASLDDFRGQLTSKKTFDANGNMVQKQENAYNLSKQSGYPTFRTVYGLKVGARRQSNAFLNGCPMIDNFTGWTFDYTFYSLFQLWPTLASTRKVTYGQGSSDSLVETSVVRYDTVTLQPSTQLAWNSKGDSVKDNYKYVPSFAGSPVYDTMIAQNMIVPIVQNEHFFDTTFQYRNTTNYQLWTTGNRVIGLPANKQTTWPNRSPEIMREFTSYDSYGNLLSQNAANDAKISYIWDYGHHLPIAQVANAQPTDIAYTSFESDGTGNFTIGSTNRDLTNAMTGTLSYNLTSGNISKSGLSSSTTYVVSYWSKSGSATVNGTTTSSSLSKRGWNYFEHRVTGSSSVTISGAVIVDELRLYPAGAQMTSYVYSPFIGMTSVSPATGRLEYYEYDGLQRLLRIRDMDNNVLKQYEYKYQVPIAPYLSAPLSRTYTRNSCGAAYIGGSYIYSLPLGKYRSSVDQLSADLQARADTLANGQHFADSLGPCTFKTVSVTASNSSNRTITLLFHNLTWTPGGDYTITLNPGTTNLNLGQFYYGTYDITMTPSSPNNGYYLNYTAAGTTQTNYVATTFSSVSMTSNISLSVSLAPCSGSTCSGNNHKCINSVCETGNLQLISETYTGGHCVRKYGYFFSDGTYIYDHSENAPACEL